MEMFLKGLNHARNGLKSRGIPRWLEDSEMHPAGKCTAES